MRAVEIGQAGGFELTAADRQRMERHAERALRRARRHGEALASITVALGGADPMAVVAASRQGAEDWFALEQPDRGGFALAALGCARAIEPGGAERFADAGRTWRALAAEAAADPPD